MQRLFAVFLATLAVTYAGGAFHFFVQERWAREPPESLPGARLRHPEATLALAQSRFEMRRFGKDELEVVRRALAQAPSFYQPPFLLATFHASRLEEPSRARAAYETAVSRYPANGRLRLAYGTWLLESRASLDGWRDPENEASLRDPLPTAEEHLKAAMELEPELAWTALGALARNRIPPSRWTALVPDHSVARTHLLDALFQAGELPTVWQWLREGAIPRDNPITLRRIVYWGLEGKRPDVALEAAQEWLALVERNRGDGSDVLDPALAVSRAHLALGDAKAADDVLQETLGKVESKFGTTSRISLDFLCALGNEYLTRGHVVTAETLYELAVSRSPSYVPALLGLARSLRRAGEDDAAVRRYEEVLRAEPANAPAREELKSLLLRRNLR